MTLFRNLVGREEGRLMSLKINILSGSGHQFLLENKSREVRK